MSNKTAAQIIRHDQPEYLMPARDKLFLSNRSNLGSLERQHFMRGMPRARSAACCTLCAGETSKECGHASLELLRSSRKTGRWICALSVTTGPHNRRSSRIYYCPGEPLNRYLSEDEATVNEHPDVHADQVGSSGVVAILIPVNDLLDLP